MEINNNIGNNKFEEKFNMNFMELYEEVAKWQNDSFICYSVKELAYEIYTRMFNITKARVEDLYIGYKLINNNGQYIHRIGFMLQSVTGNDIGFIFNLKWQGSALTIYEWSCHNDIEEFDLEDIEMILGD